MNSGAPCHPLRQAMTVNSCVEKQGNRSRRIMETVSGERGAMRIAWFRESIGGVESWPMFAHGLPEAYLQEEGDSGGEFEGERVGVARHDREPVGVVLGLEGVVFVWSGDGSHRVLFGLGPVDRGGSWGGLVGAGFKPAPTGRWVAGAHHPERRGNPVLEPATNTMWRSTNASSNAWPSMVRGRSVLESMGSNHRDPLSPSTRMVGLLSRLSCVVPIVSPAMATVIA